MTPNVKLCIDGTLQHGFDLIYAVGRLTKVNDSMTIRADRAQIFDWVNNVLFADGGQWFQMMDVNIAISRTSIYGTKIEPANRATCPVMLDAFVAGNRISLEGADLHGKACALDQRFSNAEFFLE